MTIYFHWGEWEIVSMSGKQGEWNIDVRNRKEYKRATIRKNFQRSARVYQTLVSGVHLPSQIFEKKFLAVNIMEKKENIMGLFGYMSFLIKKNFLEEFSCFNF